MLLRNLWLLKDVGGKWEVERLATTADLVAALIAEGGEIRETHLSHRTGSGEVERAITAPVHGRYLVYGPIPAEEKTT